MVRLEHQGFHSDRFERRQIRHLLTRANATCWIVAGKGEALGAAIMLWREGSTVGHLYSIVVQPKFRGRGLGNRLLRVCERAARRRGCERMSLEVRADNRRARQLYESLGYRLTAYLRDYYQGGSDGLRLVKILKTNGRRSRRPA
ncbi:MAG: GNAT family N-acetyltransferase [Gemmatimonadetes bacterium]|nr:GNAT family N-acetyltransferase [Gemmatimonadota bacterium]